MLLFILLISVIVIGAVRFNESDLVIELQRLQRCNVWANNYSVDIDAIPVDFITRKAWGFYGYYNITNDQLQNLKWTHQMVKKSGKDSENVGDTGETEKKELDEICNTALWNEMGRHQLLSTPINFTRIFPEDQELYHGERQHHYIRFYDNDSVAACIVMTIGIHTPEELEEKRREFDKKIQKG